MSYGAVDFEDIVNETKPARSPMGPHQIGSAVGHLCCISVPQPTPPPLS